METCEHCGFAWELVSASEIAPRLVAAAEALGSALAEHPQVAPDRPEPTRWSSIEYGAHLRDVLLTIRDRTVIGLVEDHPEFKPLYRDERIELGLYRDDDTEAVRAELGAAAAMLSRMVNLLDTAQLDRPVQYGFPAPMTRTVLWMGQQAVHESEHHLGDVLDNIRLLTDRAV
jgi:hypothetical protein